MIHCAIFWLLLCLPIIVLLIVKRFGSFPRWGGIYLFAYSIALVVFLLCSHGFNSALIISKYILPFWDKLGGFREQYEINHYLLFILLGAGLLVHTYQSRKRILSIWTVSFFMLIAILYVSIAAFSDIYELLPVGSAISYYFIVFLYVVFRLLRGGLNFVPYIKGESNRFRAFIYKAGKGIEIIIDSIHSALKFETKKKADEQKANGFFYDIPIITEENLTHGLRREDAAKKIAELISQTNNADAAFAVGISGKWGSGKTSFMNFIIKELKKDRNSNNRIIIEFSPWKNHGASTIIVDFFKTLGAALAPYIFRIKPKLLKYASLLLDSDAVSGNVQKAVKAIKALTTADNSIETLYKEIKEDILRLDHQLVICIDDLDRLYANEIIETLKLIRNSANFGNTVFIVTYDKDYVLANIGEEIKNHENYLEKIVSVEFYLPFYEKTILSKHFYNLIEKSLDESVALNIKEELQDFDFFSHTYFISLREVVCLANNFKVSYNLMQKDCVTHHLLMIEYLKYKHVDVYNKLFYDKNNILSIDNGVLIFNSEYNSIKIESPILLMLDYLFKKTDKISASNKINHDDYYDSYFFGRIPENHLTYVEFDSLIKADKDQFDKKISGKKYEPFSVIDKIIKHNIITNAEYCNIVDLAIYSLKQFNKPIILKENISVALCHKLMISQFDTHILQLNNYFCNPIYPCYVEKWLWSQFIGYFDEYENKEEYVNFEYRDFKNNDPLLLLKRVFEHDKSFTYPVLYHWCNPNIDNRLSFLSDKHELEEIEAQLQTYKAQLLHVNKQPDFGIRGKKKEESKYNIEQNVYKLEESKQEYERSIENGKLKETGSSEENIDYLVNLCADLDIKDIISPLLIKYINNPSSRKIDELVKPVSLNHIDTFLRRFERKFPNQTQKIETVKMIFDEMKETYEEQLSHQMNYDYNEKINFENKQQSKIIAQIKQLLEL